MNTDNIRSYAVGQKGYEVMAIVWLDDWVVELSPGRLLQDDNVVSLFHTLHDAIEAGKAYLIANGGEVYQDGEDDESTESQDIPSFMYGHRDAYNKGLDI